MRPVKVKLYQAFCINKEEGPRGSGAAGHAAESILPESLFAQGDLSFTGLEKCGPWNWESFWFFKIEFTPFWS